MSVQTPGAGCVRTILRTSAVPYLIAIALATPLFTLANYLWADRPFLKAQPLSLVLMFACVGIAFLLWIPYRALRPSGGLSTAFLLGNIVAWAVISWLVKADGDGFSFAVWLVSPILLMLLLKPPTFRAALCGADAFALAMLAISIVSHLLHVTHVFEFPHAFTSRLPEFLRGFGLANRWEGPFGSTSDAGPVGAFLTFYSLLRHNWRRWVLLVGGLFILVASWSWTSVFAAVGGLVVLLWFSPKIGPVALTTTRRVLVTIVVVLGGIIFVALKDPTFNGRIPIWDDYVHAWLKYPWLGMGTNGILSHMQWFTHQHAHNYYIDILTRHGLLGFLATVPVIVLAGILAFSAGRRGLLAIPALFTVWATCLVGETLIDWRYLGYVLMELLFIGTIAASYRTEVASQMRAELPVSPDDTDAQGRIAK